MIAADRTSQAGGNANGEQLGLGRENRHDDRDEDAEGAPARARGKRETKRDEEDDRRQHAIQAGGGALHQPGNEDIGAECGRRELEGEREGEDEQRRDHRPEAIDNADSRIAEADDASAQQIDEGEDERDDGAPWQADRRIGIAKRQGKITVAFGLRIPEAADEHHADYAEHDEDDDGDEHVDELGARVVELFLVAERAEHAIAIRLDLGTGHGAVVEAHDDDDDDEDNGEQRVEVVGNRLDEELDARDTGIKIGRRGRHGRSP